jgi:hypothetical protein
MQPLTPRTSDPNLTREAAEARMLELLNESRAKAAVNAVVADAELQSIARAHCEDMAEHHFVGHVSPTTGSAENRVRKARVRASRVAECVAREVTPEDAHDGLLSSPAHRMSMLDPLFTHVGVGVCFRQEPDAQRALLAVLLLARRPAAAELHQNPASLFAVIQSARGKQRLPKAVHEAGLQAAADAGMRALLASRDVPQRRAFEVANSVLQTDADRTRKNHAVCLTLSELLEARELEELPIVLEPEAVKFGLGVGVRNTQAGPVLSVLLAAEGADGKRINCR